MALGVRGGGGGGESYDEKQAAYGVLGSVSSTKSLSVGKKEHQTPRKRSLHLSGEGGEVVG